MFVTTIAALVYTSYGLLKRSLQERKKERPMVGNTVMGLVGFFLVIAAILLAVEGAKGIQQVSGIEGTTCSRRESTEL